METRIEMVAVSRPVFSFTSTGSAALAVRAAKRCLREAGIDQGKLELLIYTGIYPDDYLGEPAIAAIIQERIGANPQSLYNHKTNRKIAGTTFSFDLNNGGCGLVNAIQIVDGFIRSGRIRCGMIVTGDSEPVRGLSDSFHFTPAGAALILSESLNGEGFIHFKTDTHPQHENAFTSQLAFDSKKGSKKKHNLLFVKQDKSYLEWCINCTMNSLNHFLQEAGLDLQEVDLMITSQSPEGFALGLKERLDLGDRIVTMNGKPEAELHTAGLAFALRKAWEDNRFKQARNILLLTVGSGITTALSLYRNRN